MYKKERTSNFKVGWILPGRVAALTHFHSEITAEDISGVMKASINLLERVTQEFDLIIDNRVAPINQLYSLGQLQQSSPLLCHPYLRNLILVKPLEIPTIGKDQESEENGNVILYNVESISDALRILRNSRNHSDLDKINIDFFPMLKAR